MSRKSSSPVHACVQQRPEQSGSDSHVSTRRYNIHLPVVLRLKNKNQDIPGVTSSISLQRVRFFSDQILSSGFPLALQFRVGNGICYFNAAGQVISCLPSDSHLRGKYLIEVQLVALREIELRMLESALEEMSHHVSARQDSLLTIHGTRDKFAEEATRLAEQASKPQFTKQHPVEETISERPWISELKRRTQPHWEAILTCRLVQEGSMGTLSLERMKGWILQLYPFIETFPKWIALSLVKSSDHETRGFLIDNIRVEKKHAAQWVQMAEGFGLDKSDLYSVEPIPAVDALTHWLWSINTQGTLAEAISATNYAIEGVTQGIAKLGVQGLPHYAGMPGITLDKRALAWMQNHAKYDDVHPVQALRVMELYTTSDLEEKVIFASRRSLEYLLMALEACYIHFGPPDRVPNILRPRKIARSKL